MPEWMYPPGPAGRKMADELFEELKQRHPSAYMISVAVREDYNGPPFGILEAKVFE
jgi:hypothetical protein